MIDSAASYHAHTAYRRDNMSPHFLDWENRPSVYKTYPQGDIIELPREVDFPRLNLSTLIRGKGAHRLEPLDVEGLSRLLLFTNCLSAKARQGQETVYFRSVPSAGALYPTELYMAALGVKDLENGLYHLSLAQHRLVLLRPGHVSLSGAIHADVGPCPILTLLLTTIFFRSTWKYGSRAYRYHLLDTGHVLENLILAVKSLDLPFTLAYDFDDHHLNQALGVDPSREVTLAVGAVPGKGQHPLKDQGELSSLPPSFKEASRVSPRETDYPQIAEIHRAGNRILSGSGPRVMDNLGITPPERWVSIEEGPWPEVRGYGDTVFLRRSRRNFVSQPLTRNKAMALLEGLCHGGSGEPPGSRPRTLATGILLNRVQGFEPGFYLLDGDQKALGLILRGDLVSNIAPVCLHQDWLKNAAVHALFLTNLEILDSRWGPRGYRYAMLEGGRMGERLYLMATALGLGCCGIGAFYDNEASQLLGLNRESGLLYLVAVGTVKSS